MPLTRTRYRELLEAADFTRLFNELGWDNCKAMQTVQLPDRSVNLKAVAEKRGFIVWSCQTPVGETPPDYNARCRIEREVTKLSHEHLIIFTDAGSSRQIWQWVRREAGQPLRVRPMEWSSGQKSEALIQSLERLYISFEEEETVTLLDVAARASANVNEKVTKRFYDEFRKQHGIFLGFIEGIPNQSDHEWYASVMLNRLMFVYFIQKKGFLDADPDYLRNRLNRLKAEKQGDRFYSFYRYFLLSLFHNGLGAKDRNPQLQQLIGRVPYLNGGIFDVHHLERTYGDDIRIPDEAFESVFDYFDKYQWHLDERPLKADNEINPDVLGYIFEKYINQKQMGAYYTKEDITEYISKSTIIPFIFDAARAKCQVAFENPDGPTVWDLIRGNADRYVFPAVRHGCELDLPDDIANGIDTTAPDLIERRKAWNKPAPGEYALPTEIWRETVARRQRYAKVKRKLEDGEVRDINDFITLNLDIRQFAQDVILNCEGPDLLMALWQAITKITILDPTGGSGAFLFAALNILEPLYESCLDRMEAFLSEWETIGKRAQPNYQSKFSDVIARIAVHPNRRYFVLKSIILNNLYAVDIMEEAVEICKLRLFLKLAAQVESDATRENLGIEPLPDIDFNIRAGNTLVGYATYDEVKNAVTKGLDFAGAMDKIAEKAADIQWTFDEFRRIQTEGAGTASASATMKVELIDKLTALESELNTYLAAEYGVKVSDKVSYSKWLETHLPFHWFVQFFVIVQDGGFDVVIGNPPYVSAAKVRKQYTVKNLSTADCSDMYAWVLERAESLLRDGGRSGMIVPLSLAFSGDFESCRRFLYRKYGDNWFSSFGRIPAALFAADVRVRNTIHVGHKSKRAGTSYTTRLHRWFEVARPTLIPTLQYVPYQPALWKYRIPKLNSTEVAEAFQRIISKSIRTLDLSTSSRSTKHVLHFKKSAYNWLNFCRSLPPCYEGDRRVDHTKFGQIYFNDAATSQLALLLANGKLMIVFWFIIGDDFDVTRWNFAEFPADLSKINLEQRELLLAIAPKLEEAMEGALQFKLNAGRLVGNYNLAKCRSITDQSDIIFAESLGLADVWEDIELYYVQTMKTDFTESEED